MFEADWWPHKPGAGGESQLAAAHRAVGEIGLAEASLGPFAALERSDHDRSDRPGELRFPDKAYVPTFAAHAAIVTPAAREQLPDAAVDPTLLAICRPYPDTSRKFERI